MAHLVGGAVGSFGVLHLHTSSYWYYRACRAGAAGGAGRLSGPFKALGPSDQASAVAALLSLPGSIGLPDPRMVVPEMVAVHRRHPRLNLLNVEATAAAIVLGGDVLLSEPSAQGLLPGVLDAESIGWRRVAR